MEERMKHIYFVLLFAISMSGSIANADVWVERSTTRVLKDRTENQGLRTVSLNAAGNEWVNFQVVIKAKDTKIDNVSASLGSLKGPDNAVISSKNARFYLEYYINIEKPSPCDQLLSKDCKGLETYKPTPGYYPDPLIPFYDPYSEKHEPVAIPFSLNPGDLQTVFVDLFVPADTPAGKYTGSVMVASNKMLLKSIPVTLTVWDFNLPVKRNIATSFGFNRSRVFKYHATKDEADKQRILKNYEVAAHEHRIDFTTYNPGLHFKFDDKGQLKPVDYTAYDAYIGPRVDGSYFPDHAGLNRYNTGLFSPGHGLMGMTEDEFAVAAADFAEHLNAKGWLKHTYIYSLDEPWGFHQMQNNSYDKIRQGIKLLHKKTDLWKGHVLVTDAWEKILGDLIDIWCPVTSMYDGNYWNEGAYPDMKKYDELRKQGKELWFYVCNADFPPLLGLDIDAKFGYEPRLLMWGSWFEKATGFLYWRINYWMDPRPWDIVANYAQFGEYYARNGDGILIYPGNHKGDIGSPQDVAIDGPVLSYRLKEVRDGLQDWEMLLMAQKLGAGDFARAQVSRCYKKFGIEMIKGMDTDNPPWTQDETELLDARKQVALKIQYLLHPDKYQDPEPQVPEEAEDSDYATDIAMDIIETQNEEDRIEIESIHSEGLTGSETKPEDTHETTSDTNHTDITTLPAPENTGNSCATANNTRGGPFAIMLLMFLVLWTAGGRQRQ